MQAEISKTLQDKQVEPIQKAFDCLNEVASNQQFANFGKNRNNNSSVGGNYRELVELIQKTKASCTFASSQIQELNDWHQLLHGEFKRTEEVFDLHQCINMLVEQARQEVKDNPKIKIRLLNNFSEDKSNYVPQMVISDQTRFRQCASTLIKNAIANTLRGSINLIVRFDPYKKKIAFEVEDFAKKMEKKEIDKLKQISTDLNQLSLMLEALQCPIISQNNNIGSFAKGPSTQGYLESNGIGLFVC